MLKIVLFILAVFIVICLWVLLYDTHNFVVRKYSLSSPKIKKATRMVMLSDLHNYRYGKENEMLLSAIEKQKPDMIVIAGDMITAKPKEKMEHTLDLIEKLQEKYPLYYAFGNHEQKIHIRKDCKDIAGKFDEELQKRKIHPFVNERVCLEERGIALYGICIGHEYFQRFSKKPMEKDYIQSLLGKCEDTCYSVLLAHNPDYFPEYASWGADLTLAGHVHGGVVRIPFWRGVISPAIKLFPKYDGGMFREGDKSMILGRGIGTHSPNVRLFNPGELVVVDLNNLNL